jgi:hypothetical protein
MLWLLTLWQQLFYSPTSESEQLAGRGTNIEQKRHRVGESWRVKDPETSAKKVNLLVMPFLAYFRRSSQNKKQKAKRGRIKAHRRHRYTKKSVFPSDAYSLLIFSTRRMIRAKK